MRYFCAPNVTGEIKLGHHPQCAGLDRGGGRAYKQKCGLLLRKGRPAFRAYRSDNCGKPISFLFKYLRQTAVSNHVTTASLRPWLLYEMHRWPNTSAQAVLCYM